jgi:hypothetical protein
MGGLPDPKGCHGKAGQALAILSHLVEAYDTGGQMFDAALDEGPN